MKSHHNTAEMQTYFFLDNEVPSDRNYYRLRMVDWDETFEYSDIIMVRVEQSNAEIANEANIEINVSPNPVSTQATINIKSPIATKINMRLLAMAGNVLQQNTVELEEDENTQEIDMSSYLDGIYFLVITRRRNVQTHKIVKKG